MLEIRQCRSGDFGEIIELLRQLWPGKPMDSIALRKVFDRAVASESQIYLCATNGQRIVGFGSLTLKNNLWQEGYVGHVDELVVDSEFRGRGIGSQLLNQLVIVAQQQHCRRIELDSGYHRKEAHEFYRQHGLEDRALHFSRPL